jgi:putative transposase
LPVGLRRTMMEPGDSYLSLRRQADLLGVHRSGWYYKAAPLKLQDLQIKHALDELYTSCPFYGSRRMAVVLSERLQRNLNRKYIQRLMREMGIQAIGPKPNLSKPILEHKIYPYLLRNRALSAPNEVWSTDITYIRLSGGFAFLTAVIDWYSRYVLSWKLSNTMDTRFCIEAVEEALDYGTPKIFNTDQGSQFTSQDFINILLQADIQISMDGRGRALDNVFVERLWRSVKYENVYPMGYQTIPEAEYGLRNYFDFYNHERPHQSLSYRYPKDVHFNNLSGC